jgi:23S rRNA pseudouridine2605 synthase
VASENDNDKGERIAKRLARAGVCSRRDAEKLIAEGRVSVDGHVLDSPATLVTDASTISVDGKVVGAPERTRMWRYHKARGTLTTNRDPQGRATIYDDLPPGIPRVISVGRLDYNSEGLLLLTNDGTLARELELPDTAWVRRYRVRAFGEIGPAEIEKLAKGMTISGIRYGAIEAQLDRQQGDNVWITMGLREGKNREIRKVLEALGLKVSRLIRVAYGPFQLGRLEPGEIEEVPGKVLADQLGRTPQATAPSAAAKRAARSGGHVTARPRSDEDELPGEADAPKPWSKNAQPTTERPRTGRPARAEDGKPRTRDGAYPRTADRERFGESRAASDGRPRHAARTGFEDSRSAGTDARPKRAEPKRFGDSRTAEARADARSKTTGPKRFGESRTTAEARADTRSRTTEPKRFGSAREMDAPRTDARPKATERIDDAARPKVTAPKAFSAKRSPDAERGESRPGKSTSNGPRGSGPKPDRPRPNADRRRKK